MGKFDFSFVDGSSLFCFLLIEFTFSIADIITYVHYYCIFLPGSSGRILGVG